MQLFISGSVGWFRDRTRYAPGFPAKGGYHIVHTFTGTADDSLSMGYTRRLDRDMLVEFTGDFGRKFFYVCGPPAFCYCVVRYLLEFKVERERIKMEKYD